MPRTATDHLTETRRRLIEAAGPVFVEHGLEGATVRDICRRAGANIAAVNYHFGDKRGLYRATFEHHFQEGMRRHPPDEGVCDRDPPELRLKVFIRSFFHRLFSRGGPEWFAQLMLREMIRPTGVLDALVDGQMHRTRDLLSAIVREIVGRRLTDRQLFHACCSVVSQVVFHKHCTPIIRRMWPAQGYSPDDIELLADHVWRFTLAGLEAMRPRERPRINRPGRARIRTRAGGRSKP